MLFFWVMLGSSAQAEQPAPFDWLVGCWTTTHEGQRVQEVWLDPEAGMLVGAGVSATPDGAHWEQMRIEQRPEGWVYIASPEGQQTHTFNSTVVEGARAVFEDPEHDFPQRITYSRISDRLEVRVEARSGEQWRGFGLSFARCEPDVTAQESRDTLSRLLMQHPKISEASLAPFVGLRDQPYRIYKRYEQRKGAYYKECGGRYEAIGDRYHRLRYESMHGVFVEGVLAVPEDFDPNKRYPVMIFNHGNWQEGRRFTFCFTHTFEMWTRQGFVVLAPQYQGVAGGEGVDMWGGEDLDDVLRLTEIAHELPFAQSHNVFMMGNSRGGMMTYLAIKEGAELNAAVVNCGVAVVEPGNPSNDVVARLYGDGPADELAAAYTRRSAVAWAERLQVPLLIVHGGKDEGVPVAGAKRLARQLEKHGLDHELWVYKRAGHCGEGYPVTHEADVITWVKGYLREAP